jgi:hypothetical protein
MRPQIERHLERPLFFLICFGALACLIDLNPVFNNQRNIYEMCMVTDRSSVQGVSADALYTKFLLQEYETVTAEISSRIEQEHLLFVLKFTVVGAVLGLIFNFYKAEAKGDKDAFLALRHSSGVAICCWAAVAVAAIIDVRIFFNTSLIAEAGEWVKRTEQILLASSGFLGWEQSLARSRLRDSSITPWLFADRQLLTWVLYVVTLGIFVPRGNDTPSKRVQKMAFLGVSLCTFLFFLAGLYFYFKTERVGFYLAACLILLALSMEWIKIRGNLPPEGVSDKLE